MYQQNVLNFPSVYLEGFKVLHSALKFHWSKSKSFLYKFLSLFARYHNDLLSLNQLLTLEVMSILRALASSLAKISADSSNGACFLVF